MALMIGNSPLAPSPGGKFNFEIERIPRHLLYGGRSVPAQMIGTKSPRSELVGSHRTNTWPQMLVPVGAGYVGDAAVRFEKLVGHLKHRQHKSALRRPGDMACSGFTPDELTGTDLGPPPALPYQQVCLRACKSVRS